MATVRMIIVTVTLTVIYTAAAGIMMALPASPGEKQPF